jgi:hypothetical protein
MAGEPANGAGTPSPSSPAATKTQSAPTEGAKDQRVLSRADLEATARASGRSIDQVIAAARAKGYTIQG